MATADEEKPMLTCYVSKELVAEKNLNAGQVVRELGKFIQGGGGGQPFFATAGGKNIAGIQQALEKAIDFVKENLSDTDLNIEKMSSVLNLSRVHLYRKLKALTNQNPTEFVRTIRLKQAAWLLSQGKLNISEVAYMVGFNSHQYFTNSFQKYYNMSPTEFSRKSEKEE